MSLPTQATLWEAASRLCLYSLTLIGCRCKISITAVSLNRTPGSVGFAAGILMSGGFAYTPAGDAQRLFEKFLAVPLDTY
ncbi:MULTISPECIES: hypothetical protein [Calothrix]|uniref:Uncharacterized protein n=2 Tax=Calothrix TaxID=1186 RepID=A0ABR8AGU8_9CYAN|nr:MULTISPECIES: hypothetical protein [Calothrix]MBD2198445.1 hypothetical protein [Calothrix parietina FACHB-288]MBD2226847.1 hypothetical protein [Calothrix anomala FACHB-343]